MVNTGYQDLEVKGKIIATGQLSGASLSVSGTAGFSAIDDNARAAIRNKFFPVGSIYISTTNTSPSGFMGGTWTPITDDAYLKIVTSGGGAVGGTSSAHTMPISSMPSHTHDKLFWATNQEITLKGGGTSVTKYGLEYAETATGNEGAIHTGYTGGGAPYKPWYYGVYAWRRLAD